MKIEIRYPGTLASMLALRSPFYFDDEERRESGHTACRTLAETAKAFHAWCEKSTGRRPHPMAFLYSPNEVSL